MANVIYPLKTIRKVTLNYNCQQNLIIHRPEVTTCHKKKTPDTNRVLDVIGKDQQRQL